jgi:hypothetical protein
MQNRWAVAQLRQARLRLRCTHVRLPTGAVVLHTARHGMAWSRMARLRCLSLRGAHKSLGGEQPVPLHTTRWLQRWCVARCAARCPLFNARWGGACCTAHESVASRASL